MEITLTPEQESLVRYEIESGRLQTSEEAVQQAMSQWEERRRDLVELIEAIEEGEADLAAGRYTEYDEKGLLDLAEEIKREGRAERVKRAS